MLKRFISKFHISEAVSAIKLMGVHKRAFIGFNLFFVIIAAVSFPFISIGLRDSIRAIMDSRLSDLPKCMLMLVIGYLMWDVSSPAWSYFSGRSASRAILDIRFKLSKKLMSISQKDFDKRRSGEMFSIADNDMNSLKALYDWNFYKIFEALFGGLSGLIIMAYMDWRFAIITIVLGVLNIKLSAYFSVKLNAQSEALRLKIADSGVDAYALVKEAKLIRALKLASIRKRRIFSRLNAETGVRMSMAKTSASLSSVTYLLTSLSYLALIAYGAFMASRGLMDWATVAAVTVYIRFAVDSIFSELPQYISSMNENIAGAVRVMDVLKIPDEDDYCANHKFSKQDSAVSIKSVSFSYDSDKRVIDGFSAEIPARGLTIIMGESGSGKSTLMKLILGLYEPDKGVISLCGSGEATRESVMSYFSYVPQKSMLINGTVLSNIAVTDAVPDKEKALMAAHDAGLDGVLSNLPNGIDSPLSDDGRGLSGGEQQRVSIARAIYKGANVLLLDEITSALDIDTAERITATIVDIARAKSVVWITHDHTRARYADNIINLSGRR